MKRKVNHLNNIGHKSYRVAYEIYKSSKSSQEWVESLICMRYKCAIGYDHGITIKVNGKNKIVQVADIIRQFKTRRGAAIFAKALTRRYKEIKNTYILEDVSCYYEIKS